MIYIEREPPLSNFMPLPRPCGRRPSRPLCEQPGPYAEGTGPGPLRVARLLQVRGRTPFSIGSFAVGLAFIVRAPFLPRSYRIAILHFPMS